MEENLTRVCELLVGSGEVEVLGVDDKSGEPRVVGAGRRVGGLAGRRGASGVQGPRVVGVLVPVSAVGGGGRVRVGGLAGRRGAGVQGPRVVGVLVPPSAVAGRGWFVPSHEILLRSRLGLMQGDADVQTVPEES